MYIAMLDMTCFSNARKICEHLEDMTFDSIQAFKDTVLQADVGTDTNNPFRIQVYSITDFMDACNDEDINLDEYFITYFNIKDE